MTTNKDLKDINSFTRLLWWISGVSPEILIQYPSEYTKFSAIGMTIAMTCLVAFVSGMSAAWYFSSNFLATFCFGCFWATLIFCIDRALVVTMKKKPGESGWSIFFKIICPRAVLALLVAFLMSIPLELIVFQDLITLELPNYKDKVKEDASRIGLSHQIKQEAEKNSGKIGDLIQNNKQVIEDAEKDKTNAENKVNSIESQISAERNKKNNPTTSAYLSAQKSYNDATNKLNSPKYDSQLRKRYSSQRAAAKSAMEIEKKRWNEQIDTKIASLEKEKQEANKVLRKSKEDLSEANKAQRDLIKQEVDNQVIINDAIKETGEKSQEIDSLLKESNKFLLYYQVLEYAIYAKQIERIPVASSVESENKESYIEEESYKNRQALIMLWLIRALFFVFELMPTVVKAVSKPGPYEHAVLAEDEQIESFLTSSNYKDHMQTILKDRLTHEKQLESDRQKAEKDLHDQLVSKIQAAQEKVAVAAIDKWEKEQLNTIRTATSHTPAPSSTSPNTPKAPTLSYPSTTPSGATQNNDSDVTLNDSDLYD